MTDPKVSELEMSAYLDGLKSGYHVRWSMREEDEVIDAIRAAIEERERLREGISSELIHATAQAIIQALRREWIPPKEGISMSDVIENVLNEMFAVLGIPVFRKPNGDFKLDGEEEK